MVKSKPYKAYVNELGEVIIDFDGDNFRHSYPYTVKHLTLLEEGSSPGGNDLVSIHARLSTMVKRRAARRFELFMGCLGNGITVCNKAVMEHGDYKKVAHISEQGEVKWYVEPGYTPASDVVKIREAAAVQQNKYEAWWASLSEAKRYEITLDRMSPAELVEHLRQKQAERAAARELNSICEKCLALGNGCDGTTEKVWTGCVHRRIGGES